MNFKSYGGERHYSPGAVAIQKMQFYLCRSGHTEATGCRPCGLNQGISRRHVPMFAIDIGAIEIVGAAVFLGVAPQWEATMRRTAMNTRRLGAVALGAALLTLAPISLGWSPATSVLSLQTANARVGRPLTPGSVAGVHRRTTRRAYYGAAAAGAAATGAYYYNHAACGYGSYPPCH